MEYNLVPCFAGSREAAASLLPAKQGSRAGHMMDSALFCHFCQAVQQRKKPSQRDYKIKVGTLL